MNEVTSCIAISLISAVIELGTKNVPKHFKLEDLRDVQSLQFWDLSVRSANHIQCELLSQSGKIGKRSVAPTWIKSGRVFSLRDVTTGAYRSWYAVFFPLLRMVR